MRRFLFLVFVKAGQGRLRHPAAGASRASRGARTSQGFAVVNATEVGEQHQRGRIRDARACARQEQEVRQHQLSSWSHPPRLLHPSPR